MSLLHAECPRLTQEKILELNSLHKGEEGSTIGLDGNKYSIVTNNMKFDEKVLEILKDKEIQTKSIGTSDDQSCHYVIFLEGDSPQGGKGEIKIGNLTLKESNQKSLNSLDRLDADWEKDSKKKFLGSS